MKKPIIFKHIPKSGGTFIFKNLAKEFKHVKMGYNGGVKSEKSFGKIATPFTSNNHPPAQVINVFEKQIIEKYGDIKYYEKLIDISNCDNIDSIELLSAHFMFEKLKKSDDYYLLSCIRNPVDMFYSELSYHNQGRNIKHLIDIEIDKLDNWRYDYIKNVIDTCDFVGVQEYMGETIKHINKEFNTNINNNTKINVGLISDYSYRRKEVEAKCSESLKLYNNYVEFFKVEYP
jgi:hypothetical protein